jgi:uncharacterized tellurite resistance protein B-like protein
MNLTDLTHEERVALVALVVQMVGADGHRTDEEMAEFREIADEMGKRDFDEAMREVQILAGTRAEAIAYAKSALTRPGARDIVYTILVDLAGADYVSDEEKALIRDVATALGVQTRF